MTKPYIPNCIVSTKNFSSGTMVAIGELKGKRWTDPMISLLGQPDHKNEKGVKFWSIDKVRKVGYSEDFRRVLALELKDWTTRTYPEYVWVSTFFHIAEGCNTLLHLNRLIKEKKITGSEANKIYEYKAFFIKYLYDNGYAMPYFEENTDQFYFVISVRGETYVWHQPKRMVNYISEYTVLSRNNSLPAETTGNTDFDKEVLLKSFEPFIIQLLISTL